MLAFPLVLAVATGGGCALPGPRVAASRRPVRARASLPPVARDLLVERTQGSAPAAVDREQSTPPSGFVDPVLVTLAEPVEDEEDAAPDPEIRPSGERTIVEEAPGFSDGVEIRQRPGRPRLMREPGDPVEGREDQPDTRLDRPRALRRGGGGGPTLAEEDEDEEEAGEEFKSDLLIRALGLEDSPLTAFGWLQGGFTGNPANPRSGDNFGVNPNTLANDYEFQQLYFVLEKPLDAKARDAYGFGYRIDSLFGTDWLQYHMTGLFDNAFAPGRLGYEPVQFYGEIHLPWLTPGGIDVKGGRFLALGGYEDLLAPSRPLNSGGYLFGYAHPFTHFGMMSTWHVTDRINVYNGAVNGWDRWVNRNYRWGYAGGVSWDSQDERTNLSLTLNAGPNQFPRFFQAGYLLEPNGVVPPPFLAGRRNVLYNRNTAVLLTSVLIHQWSDALTLVGEGDYGHETNIPGLGPGGTPTFSTWYGAAGWALYAFEKRVTGVYRAEVFRDVNGVRTGFDDSFFEMTLGLILKPKNWFWIRPEIRYDWAAGTPPYNDGKSGSQFTYGFDTIFLF
ncbi:MAG: hypothetical protein NVSMB9_34800 [Isosphaeraceae bacterium]